MSRACFARAQNVLLITNVKDTSRGRRRRRAPDAARWRRCRRWRRWRRWRHACRPSEALHRDADRRDTALAAERAGEERQEAQRHRARDGDAQGQARAAAADTPRARMPRTSARCPYRRRLRSTTPLKPAEGDRRAIVGAWGTRRSRRRWRRRPARRRTRTPETENLSNYFDDPTSVGRRLAARRR